jgi:hypothetical protein
MKERKARVKVLNARTNDTKMTPMEAGTVSVSVLQKGKE